MEDLKEISINQLPSKTWHWLNVNDTRIQWGKEMVPCQVHYEENGEDPSDFELRRMEISDGDGEWSSGTKEIQAADGKHLTLIQSFVKGNPTKANLAFCTRLHIGKDSKVRLIQIIMREKDHTLQNNVECICQEKGQLELLQMYIGTGDVYGEVRTQLAGDKAEMHTEIGYLGQGEQKIDLNLVADHLGKKTISFIKADGTLKDAAKKIFRGTIDFKNGSSGSEGEETENVLLLGDQVENRTVPLILCAEEDVKGNHGATIGALDAETLFYFASRGIDAVQAENMMTRAKLETLAGHIRDEKTEAVVEQQLLEVIGNGE